MLSFFEKKLNSFEDPVQPGIPSRSGILKRAQGPGRQIFLGLNKVRKTAFKRKHVRSNKSHSRVRKPGSNKPGTFGHSTLAQKRSKRRSSDMPPFRRRRSVRRRKRPFSRFRRQTRRARSMARRGRRGRSRRNMVIRHQSGKSRRASRPRRMFEKPELKTLHGFLNSSETGLAVVPLIKFEWLEFADPPKIYDLDPFAWTDTAGAALGLMPTKGTNATQRVGNRFSIVNQEMRFCMRLSAAWHAASAVNEAMCCRVVLIKLSNRCGYVQGDHRKYDWLDFFQTINVNSFRKQRKDLPNDFPSYEFIHDHRFNITSKTILDNRDLNIRIPSRIMKVGNDTADAIDTFALDTPSYHLFLVYQGLITGTGPEAANVPAKYTFIG